VLYEPIPPLDIPIATTAPSSHANSPQLGYLGDHPAPSSKAADLLSSLSLNEERGDSVSSQGSSAPDALGLSLGITGAAVPGLGLTCVGSYLIYSRFGLDITLKRFDNPSTPTTTIIRAVFLNDQSDYTIENLLLQVAAPKAFSIFLNPASSNVLAPHQEAIQIINIKCLRLTSQALKLRIKVSFTVETESVEDLVDFTFPE
jgi:hypothetical protein